MNKQYIVYGVGVVLIVASFFGGYKYGQSKPDFTNVTADQRQQIMQSLRGSGAQGGFGQAGNGQRRGGQGGFASGEVLNKDEKSITVKMRDNSSKIIFYSDTTTVGKSVAGNIADVTVGEQVTVTGSTNSDGSVTAQNITIRPTETTPAPGQPMPGQPNPGQNSGTPGQVPASR